MITLQNHVDFLLKFTVAFGAVFELPLIITVLARMGVVNAKMLARNRKYAILGAFIAGAVLTPTPDVFNQTLMAGPLILLYEVGILSARIFGRRRAPRRRRPPRTASLRTAARCRARRRPRRRTSPRSDRDGLRLLRSARTGHAGHPPGWLRDHHAHPGGRPAAGPQGQGRGRPVTDGYRQDGRLLDRRLHAPPALARAAGHRRRHRPAHAHHRAHARTGRADRGRRAAPRRLHAVPDPRGLRRHRLRQAARRARRGLATSWWARRAG